MRYKPMHTCFDFHPECPACAFDLGATLAKKKPVEHAKYVWAVVGTDNPCDIRRYSFSYNHAISQLAHAKKSKYKDGWSGGTWTLFKLVQVKKTPSKKFK